MTLPLPRIVRRRSRIAGWGVFAREPINKNRRIVTYDGELIRHREADARARCYIKRGEIWVFTVNNWWARDANYGGNVARFINHSCQPNCYVDIRGRDIWIRAARNIREGEELSYDYNAGGEKTIPCRCRPGCKTKL
jgi:uncharacterized protein